jgi:MYXO-CTERM domain-containing protein
VTTDCHPYACRGGACLSTCTQVADCAFPAVCDELGRCNEAREASDNPGCSVAAPKESRSSSIAAFVAALLAFGALARRRRSPA